VGLTRIQKALAKVKNSIRLSAASLSMSQDCSRMSPGASADGNQNRCEILREATVSSNFLDGSELLKSVRNSDKVMTSEVVRR
jgi:hypothetical protein